MIDIGEVQTAEKIVNVSVEAATIVWHPRQYLSYACDDKSSYNRKFDAGSLKVLGFANHFLFCIFGVALKRSIVLFYKQNNVLLVNLYDVSQKLFHNVCGDHDMRYKI